MGRRQRPPSRVARRRRGAPARGSRARAERWRPRDRIHRSVLVQVGILQGTRRGVVRAGDRGTRLRDRRRSRASGRDARAPAVPRIASGPDRAGAAAAHAAGRCRQQRGIESTGGLVRRRPTSLKGRAPGSRISLTFELIPVYSIRLEAFVKMRNGIRGVMAAVATAAVAVTFALNSTPAAGQAQYRAPRAVDGHADLHGIWQAINEANYDLETHMARAGMSLRPGPFGPLPAPQVLALGAVGAVPGGLGVVEGGEIPYKPAALAKKKDNQEHWLERDPEIKCYLPGVPRANYMPYPFQIFQSPRAIFIAYEYAGAARHIYLKDPGP